MKRKLQRDSTVCNCTVSILGCVKNVKKKKKICGRLQQNSFDIIDGTGMCYFW